MSETAVETENSEDWKGEEPDAAEVESRRRSPQHLLSAAREGVEEITRDAEAEPERVPTPQQSPETAANRAAAVQQARQPAEGQDFDEPEAEEPEAEAELPPEAPAEWLAEEPDFEAEARAELEIEPDETEEEFVDEGYVDPQIQEERVRRIAAEKRAAHLETLRLKDARKSWVTEALEHAPLAVHEFGEDLAGIEATSKRDFLRKAAAGHNKIRGIAQAISPNVKAEVDQVKAEAKAAAERGYGQPTVGPGSAPAQAGEQAAKVAAGRAQKGLRGAIGAMLDGGINP